MSPTDTDLHWLAERRPAVDELDDAATARVRQALMRELDAAGPSAGPSPVADADPDESTARLRVRPRRRSRRVAAVGVPALAVAAVVLFGVSDRGPVPVPAGGVTSAQAAPVARLATVVRGAAAPRGDATLVVRRQLDTRSGQTITGADLYADGRGGYFYAPTVAGLPAVVAAGRGREEQVFARTVAAAQAAFDGDVERARRRLADSVLEPGTPPPPEAADRDFQDHWIWGNGGDALIAGAGRPEVRAGVLHLFATIRGLTVERTTFDDRPVLQISADVFDGEYREVLTIDARTGIPLRRTGGLTGEPPTVEIDYEVRRVDLADVAAGRLPPVR